MKWSDIYTYVSEEEATRLLLAAGQAELRKMEPLAGGWANSSYLLTLEDDTQLVLKVWDKKTPSTTYHSSCKINQFMLLLLTFAL